MRDMIKMVVVITLLASLSGGLLAAVRNGTAEQIESQKLKFVQGPAIIAVLAGSENKDPVADRFKLEDGDVQRTFFLGKFDGEFNIVVFEAFGNGYGGNIGVMTGVSLETDEIIGMAVTTHQETPGLGSKAKDDPAFVAKFRGLSILDSFAVKADGGDIDAMSGATVTSRGVCEAVTKANEIYKRLKPQIKEKAGAFS